MDTIEDYERWKQGRPRYTSSLLHEWLRNDPTAVVTHDPSLWDRAAPFIMSVIALLSLFAVYRFRIRIKIAAEDLIVHVGALAIRSNRATRAAFMRIIGRMRERADRISVRDE